MTHANFRSRLAGYLSEWFAIDRDTALTLVDQEHDYIEKLRNTGRYAKTIAAELVRRRGKTFREPEYVALCKSIWTCSGLSMEEKERAIRLIARGAEDEPDVLMFIVMHDLPLLEQQRLRDFFREYGKIDKFRTSFEHSFS